MAIHLKVAGIGHDGGPAGPGSTTLRAMESGSEADKVYYKVPRGGSIDGAVRSERIQEAYLEPSERSTLDNLGVIYRSEDEVRAVGASHSVLWQVDPRTNR